VICVGLTFAGYHLYTGIDRRLGEGTLQPRAGQPGRLADSRWSEGVVSAGRDRVDGDAKGDRR
jgi:hypothetical protein